jgi:hypothetical protein
MAATAGAGGQRSESAAVFTIGAFQHEEVRLVLQIVAGDLRIVAVIVAL